LKPVPRPARTRRIFLLALAASLLMHLLLLVAPSWQLPTDNTPDTIIQARLAPLPKALPKVTPKPKPRAKRMRSASTRPRPAPPEPVIAVSESAPLASAEVVAPPETRVETRVDTTPEAVAEVTPAPPPLNPMPGKATLDYDMLLGADGVRVGKTRYIWQVNAGRYSLTSITEGTGLVKLVQPGKLVQISLGRITAAGLAPDDYWIQRGKPTPDKTTAAHFNYGLKIVTIGKMSEAVSVPLLDNSQDVLSVTFQLAQIVPFSGEKLLHVTAGKGLKPYRVHVVGEEMLNTALGTLRTLHVARVKEGDEDPVDVWLASDYNYLPVKVRVKHSKYGVVEQVISAMTVEE
jgi:hypothetical protein